MTSGVSATMRMRSPSPAPLRSTIARWVSSDRNLAIGPSDLAAGLERQMGEALGSEPARPLGQLVDLAPGDPGHPGRHDALDPAARRQGAIEDAEPGRRDAIGPDERRTEVDQLHPEAHVGLVRAEPLERLLVGHHRERRLRGSADRERSPARPRSPWTRRRP